MNSFNSYGYALAVELIDKAETPAFLDYIHYLNNVFAEKEPKPNVSFVADDTFDVCGLTSEEEARDVVNILKNMELKDFNIPSIKRFYVMHFSCNVEEVIENE